MFNRSLVVWVADDGDAIQIDMQSGKASREHIEGGPRGLATLPFTGSALLIRKAADDDWVYVAAGVVVPALCELFSASPGANMTPRGLRAWQRDVRRLTFGFETNGGADGVTEFLNDVHFPMDGTQ